MSPRKSTTKTPQASTTTDTATTDTATTDTATTDVRAQAERIAELERRVERGLRFVHVLADRNQKMIEQHAALIHGLGDTLARHATIATAEVARARDAYLSASPAPQFRIRVAPDVDKYAVEPVVIDCEARLAVCKAACCRRPFVMSTQDLEEGVLRWEFGDPYVNRRTADGQCCHHENDGRCGVHAARPLRCRSFDCREDASIWIDFDRRIPHPELAGLPTPGA